jgi:hypothetical protein
MTVVAIVLMFLINSLEVIRKEKPYISVENKVFNDYPNITLCSLTFPSSVRVSDFNDMIITQPKIFQIKTVFYDLSRITRMDELELEYCSYKNYPLISSQSFNDFNLNISLCIKNQNMTILKNVKERNDYFISIELKKCNNLTSNLD